MAPRPVKPAGNLRAAQLALPLPCGHGGARAGAGRKPHFGRARHVPHVARPRHARGCPLHVTLRCAPQLPGLRSQIVVAALEASLEQASSPSFRVIHYSVQHDHLHLVVEAADRTSLSRGMQGLAIRLARSVNRVARRRGKVWADRFHAHELRSPREVRAAIVYVLMNHKKHARSHGGPAALDAFSSAAWFDGFTARASPLVVRLRNGLPTRALPIARPRTWLARKGWRRRGLIDPGERPAGPL